MPYASRNPWSTRGPINWSKADRSPSFALVTRSAPAVDVIRLLFLRGQVLKSSHVVAGTWAASGDVSRARRIHARWMPIEEDQIADKCDPGQTAIPGDDMVIGRVSFRLSGRHR